MEKSNIFKRVLSQTLAVITLCSTATAHCETPTNVSKNEPIITVVTVGLGGLATLIGGITAMVLYVQTDDISKKIIRKEKKIIKLKAEILRIKNKIKNAKSSDSYYFKKLESELEGLENELISAETELADLKKDYIDSIQELHWQQQHNLWQHHLLHDA